MSKARFIALGLMGVAGVGGVLATVPDARHFIRREIAQHRHFKFSDTTETNVVPVHRSAQDGLIGAGDRRFSPRPSADEAVELSGPVRVAATNFDPPTVTAAGQNRFAGPPAMDAATMAPSVRTPDRDTGAEINLAGAKQAIQLYRQGNLAAADDFARPTSGALRVLLDWTAVRLASTQSGTPRLQAFLQAHPNWPLRAWVERRIEDAKAGTRDAKAIIAQYAATAPKTMLGKLALARARLATGDLDGSANLVRALWREDDLTAGEEAVLLKEFGALLRREDHKYRADRLLYKETVQPALRAAVLAGPDVVLLEKARSAVVALAPADAAIQAVPKALQNDPGLVFSKIQKARRAGKIAEATALMLAAPTSPAAVIDGDGWWVERRLVARKLLDAGDPKTAFQICAAHAAASPAMRIEAEFHAGWIALRFLHDPALAAPHFAAAAAVAETPISIARGAYWQARTAEASGDPVAAAKFYAAAAAQPTTFYGQLAAAQLGQTRVTVREPNLVVAGNERDESVQVAALLFSLGERDLALNLALAIVKTEPDEAQIAALAQVVSGTGDARATLTVGKAAAQRGLPLDTAAFPTFGIPDYTPLVNSADRSIVYAIARQESEFDPRAVSSAGAKGLMQMIASTARQTAQKAGVDFNEDRMLTDAAFNAQLGAAHLGKLLADQGGSAILTFAAYNAGARKVQEWIEAYGDPRTPGVDAVDWIERIPFTETRNYVQRVFENMQMYRARFGMPTALLTDTKRQLAGKGT